MDFWYFIVVIGFVAALKYIQRLDKVSDEAPPQNAPPFTPLSQQGKTPTLAYARKQRALQAQRQAQAAASAKRFAGAPRPRVSNPVLPQAKILAEAKNTQRNPERAPVAQAQTRASQERAERAAFYGHLDAPLQRTAPARNASKARLWKMLKNPNGARAAYALCELLNPPLALRGRSRNRF